MLLSSSALVIHTYPYSESSVIVKAYAEKFGYTSFLLKGFKKNRKQKINLHPLALVEITCVSSKQSGLKFARNIALQKPYSEILMDPIKSGLAMFLAEFLGNTVRDDQDGDSVFFAWLNEVVDELERTSNLANFHLWFLIHLSDHMGFAPQGSRTINTPHFNLTEGSFVARDSSSENCSEEESILLDRILNINYNVLALLALNKKERLILLNLLHMYFEVHLDKKITLKSLDILGQLYID